MPIARSSGPVCEKLGEIHSRQPVDSYDISDAPEGIFLYSPGHATAVHVTGRPGQVTLPAPFDRVTSPPGHEIHDKFVVRGLNGDDPVVYPGSSNLASGGEEDNGDNAERIARKQVALASARLAKLLNEAFE
jgi:hypothetical protein